MSIKYEDIKSGDAVSIGGEIFEVISVGVGDLKIITNEGDVYTDKISDVRKHWKRAD